MANTQESAEKVNDCIFCKIIVGMIPSKRVAENDWFVAIEDIQPQAKAHWLILPKKHYSSMDALVKSEGVNESQEILGKLMHFAAMLAQEKGLASDGYRSVINTHRNGGQTVFHLHLHILGGNALNGKFA